MSKLNQAQLVKYAVLHAPYLIPKYFKPPYNPLLTKGILKKMVGRSTGIEIECFGSLSWHFMNEKRDRYKETCEFFPIISSYYNCMDYSEDQIQSCRAMKTHAINLDYENRVVKDNDLGFNEHKIRISDYKQLNGLYEFLIDMKKYCRLNLGSGIHLHIDLTKEMNSTSFSENKVCTNITCKMSDIERIFYPTSKYIPKYNTERRCGNYKGHHWVALRDYTKTIEFRIAPMTFEYDEIVRWIVECQKIVNWAVNISKKESHSEKVEDEIEITEEFSTQDTDRLRRIKTRINDYLNITPGSTYTTVPKQTLVEIKTIIIRHILDQRLSIIDILTTEITWTSVGCRRESNNLLYDILNFFGISTD